MDDDSLWTLLSRIYDQRDTIHVDEGGEIVVLADLDELVAAKHVKRFINVWANRQRRAAEDERIALVQMAIDEAGSEDSEAGATYAGELRVSEAPAS